MPEAQRLYGLSQNHDSPLKMSAMRHLRGACFAFPHLLLPFENQVQTTCKEQDDPDAAE